MRIMKTTGIFFALLVSLNSVLLSGQTLSNSIISAGGGKSDNSIYSNFAVVGESFTGYDMNSYFKLYNGLLNSIEISTGIENELITSNTIRVYPNPVKDYARIELDGPDILEIEICSVSGVILKRVKIRGQCDLSYLEKGTYFIKVFNTNGVYIGVSRVVKL